MLADDNDTIEQACHVSETPMVERIAARTNRPSQTRGASLAALEGMPISSRFCSWIGLSGRRYVFSVYPAKACPAFRDAVLLAVARDIVGERRVISAHETGAFPEAVVAKTLDDLEGFGSGLEFHLYLLGASSKERAAAVVDLEIAQR